MTSPFHPSEQLTITLPITRSAEETAVRFAARQPTPEKAEQVRRNTLAVWVMHDYCQMMGIATDLDAGDSWQPLQQLGADVADLELVGVGRLECRPVGVADRDCYVPPEVWTDRIGYVAVQLDEANLEATVLGFVPTVTTEYLPLSQFRSLEQLIDRIHAPTTVSQTSPSFDAITNLGSWLVGQVTAGWQTVEALLDSLNAEPAFAFRGAVETVEPMVSDRTRRAKLIHLSTAEINYPLVLVMELATRPDGRRSVRAQVHAIESGTFLPESLRLAVLDQTGVTLLETQAREADDYMQLRFRGSPEEQFQLQIELGDTILTEEFMI